MRFSGLNSCSTNSLFIKSKPVESFFIFSCLPSLLFLLVFSIYFLFSFISCSIHSISPLLFSQLYVILVFVFDIDWSWCHWPCLRRSLVEIGVKKLPNHQWISYLASDLCMCGCGGHSFWEWISCYCESYFDRFNRRREGSNGLDLGVNEWRFEWKSCSTAPSLCLRDWTDAALFLIWAFYSTISSWIFLFASPFVFAHLFLLWPAIGFVFLLGMHIYVFWCSACLNECFCFSIRSFFFFFFVRCVWFALAQTRISNQSINRFSTESPSTSDFPSLVCFPSLSPSVYFISLFALLFFFFFLSIRLYASWRFLLLLKANSNFISLVPAKI